MKKLLAALAVTAALAGAGCGGDDSDELEARVARLESQVALQQRELERIEEDTSSLRQLEQRVDDLLDRIPSLDRLQEVLDRLGLG
jgi:hypothetical protein